MSCGIVLWGLVELEKSQPTEEDDHPHKDLRNKREHVPRKCETAYFHHDSCTIPTLEAESIFYNCQLQMPAVEAGLTALNCRDSHLKRPLGLHSAREKNEAEYLGTPRGYVCSESCDPCSVPRVWPVANSPLLLARTILIQEDEGR